MIENKVRIELTPFLRWTGSKRWFTKEHIENFLPKSFNNYHEPFLGGGAVFFYLKKLNQDSNRCYYLSDTNSDLINCYLRLQEDYKKVIKFLSEFKNTKEDYYTIRASKFKDKFKQAAMFIYLNRTSFNGIYRVNSSGIYNVPYGNREKVDILTESLLELVHIELQNVSIQSSVFDNTLKNIKKNDLVFIDPPYTVAHENNGFIEYNQTLFSWNDQLKLKMFIDKIREKGAYFILTNASHVSLTDLYQGVGKMERIGRLSKVGGRNKTRGVFNELIIYNTR